MIDVLISRCLLGEKCRYDGRGNSIFSLDKIEKMCKLIDVCPEVDAGLDTPRPASEIKKGKVVMSDGRDVTEFFNRGAQIALEKAKKHGCKAAILKAKSPSCGSGQVYDGTFSGNLINADGVTASLLKKNGIQVFTENQTEQILKFLEENK